MFECGRADMYTDGYGEHYTLEITGKEEGWGTN
jgi:hypothetical protein